MFTRIVFSAVGAGLAVGLLVAALQHVTTTPLIVGAEAFETADSQGAPQRLAAAGDLAVILAQAGDAPAGHSHDGHAADGHSHDAQAWMPQDGIERTFYTALTTVLTATGFGLMLIAAMVLAGGRIDGRSGLAWGACGFAAVALAPALGLPPELPGSAAADLVDRQIWWAGTVAATSAGIAALAFTRPWWAKALALALIVAPHIVGAPHPHEYTSTVPAELSGHFAAASLVVAAVFWVALGWAVATLFERLAPREQAAEA